MKFILFFLPFIITGFPIILNLNNKLPSTEDLRMKLFLTNQAISKLKDQISKIGAEKNKHMLKPNELKINLNESLSDEMSFRESKISDDNSEQIIESPHKSIIDEKYHNPLKDDMKQDMDLGNKVYEYFNKNTNHLNLNTIKNEIKTTGYKEINDLIDLLDNHPEEIEHGNIEHFYTQEIQISSKDVKNKKSEKIQKSQDANEIDEINIENLNQKSLVKKDKNLISQKISHLKPSPHKFLQYESNSNQNKNKNFLTKKLNTKNLKINNLNGPLNINLPLY
jgi:hypothetical protein